jgi:hypothetical protein
MQCLIDNVPVAVGQAILANLIPSGAVIEVEFDGAGHVFDRSRPDAIRMPVAKPAIAPTAIRKRAPMRLWSLGCANRMGSCVS